MKGLNVTTEMQQPEEPIAIFRGELASCGLWALVLSSASNSDMWGEKKRKQLTQTLRIKIELILLPLILRYQGFKERQQGKKLYMAITWKF